MLKPVLTANWRYVAFLNFAADPQLLIPRVPRGTELDFYGAETFISVVAFLCADTVLVDQPVLQQRLLEHAELRFYGGSATSMTGAAATCVSARSCPGLSRRRSPTSSRRAVRRAHDAS